MKLCCRVDRLRNRSNIRFSNKSRTGLRNSFHDEARRVSVETATHDVVSDLQAFIKSDVEGRNDRLQLTRLTEDEKVILSKVQEQPLASGVNKSKNKDGELIENEWELLLVNVHSFTGKDRNGLYTEEPNKECTWFPNGKLVEKMREIPVGQAVEVYMEKKEGKMGSFSVYQLKKVETQVEQPTQNGGTIQDRIKAMSNDGVDNEDIAELLSIEFDMPEETVMGIIDSMKK